MNGKALLILFSLFLLHLNTLGQVSGFISASYGYDGNPLYNYDRVADWITQTYLEMNYEKEFTVSHLRIGYVGGLMLFRRLQSRNYYEHNISSRYSVRFKSHLDQFDSASVRSGAGGGQRSPGHATMRDDSTDTYMEFALIGQGRHDKRTFKDFDNYGVELDAAYRFMVSERFFLRIVNFVGYRNYAFLSELSNVHDVLVFELGNNAGSSLDVGLRIGGGMKHFTTSVYDTSRFEPQRTYSESATGKGKGGAKLLVPSAKEILTNTGPANAFQISPGFHLLKKWPHRSLGAECLYRFNLGTSTRYLAQYANTSILSEDIYNDHFSYEGPEVQATYKQTMLLGIQSVLTATLQRKKFGAPAFDLAGNKISDHRNDVRSSVDVYLSRYVHLSERMGLDISFGAGAVRNRSSDDYNDYSAFNVSLSLGLGF